MNVVGIDVLDDEEVEDVELIDVVKLLLVLKLVDTGEELEVVVEETVLVVVEGVLTDDDEEDGVVIGVVTLVVEDRVAIMAPVAIRRITITTMTTSKVLASACFRVLNDIKGDCW